MADQYAGDGTALSAGLPAALRQLPPGYAPVRTFSVRDRGVLVMLNVVGLVLLALPAWAMLSLLHAWRPEDFFALPSEIVGLGGVLRLLLGLIAVTAVMTPLHEGIHGLFFWVFTRSKPVFSFHGYYAAASAPGWYLRRGPYLLVGLAPLALISAAGLLLVAVVPVGWFWGLLALVSLNASGAVGDLWMTLSLLRYPPASYAQDEGDQVTLWAPLR